MCLNTTDYLEYKPRIPYSRDWENPADVIAFTVGILSALCSVMILLSFLAISDLRATTSRRIVCYISLADLGSCLCQAIGAGSYFGTLRSCEIQALFTVVFSLAFVLWTTCLALYLHLSLVREDLAAAKRMSHWFHAVGWGLPLGVAITAYFMGALGSDENVATNGWCWISLTSKVPPTSWDCKYAVLLWMLVTIKGWEIVSYVLVPVLYIHVKLHLREALAPDSAKALTHAYRRAITAVDKKLVFLPLAFVVLRVWGTVRVFLFVFYFDSHPEEKTKPLFLVFQYMQALGDNAQGSVNFILFVLLTGKVRHAVASQFRKALSLCGGLIRPGSCCNRDDGYEDVSSYYGEYRNVTGASSSATDGTVEMTDSSLFGNDGRPASHGTSTASLPSAVDRRRKRWQVRRWFQQAHRRIAAYGSSSAHADRLTASESATDYGARA